MMLVPMLYDTNVFGCHNLDLFFFLTSANYFEKDVSGFTLMIWFITLDSYDFSMISGSIQIQAP